MSDELYHEFEKRIFQRLGLDPAKEEDVRAFRQAVEWADMNRRLCKTFWGRVVSWSAIAVMGGVIALTMTGFWATVRQKAGMP
jgi:hypothetical protein